MCKGIVICIHMMKDDQIFITLVHEGDALGSTLYHCTEDVIKPLYRTVFSL